MKAVWIASIAVAATSALAQTTIYKHIDESGRVTYSNKPMKGAVVLDLEPLTVFDAGPSVAPLEAAAEKAEAPKTASDSPRAPGRDALMASAICTTLASVDCCSTSW